MHDICNISDSCETRTHTPFGTDSLGPRVYQFRQGSILYAIARKTPVFAISCAIAYSVTPEGLEPSPQGPKPRILSIKLWSRIIVT